MKVNENSNQKGNYFFEKADTTAKIFAEGIVSKKHDELNAVFSPDGKEITTLLRIQDGAFIQY